MSRRDEALKAARRRKRLRRRRDGVLVGFIGSGVILVVALLWAVLTALPFIILALVLHWLGAF